MKPDIVVYATYGGGVAKAQELALALRAVEQGVPA